MAKQENTTDRNEITSQLYTIANIAHAEYHTIELLVNNLDSVDMIEYNKSFEPLHNAMVKLRQMRSSMLKQLAMSRPAVNGLWCVLKHLILTEMHFWELFEKEGNTDHLEHAKTIHLMMDELLSHDEYGKLEDCPRCETDKKSKSQH